MHEYQFLNMGVIEVIRAYTRTVKFLMLEYLFFILPFQFGIASLGYMTYKVSLYKNR